MAAADYLKSNTSLEVVEPVRGYASPYHDEVGLDALGEQENAISRKPVLEDALRFAPFPRYVGNQSLQRASKPGVQFIIIHLMNAHRLWKHVTKIEVGAKILGKRQGKNASLGGLQRKVRGIDN